MTGGAAGVRPTWWRRWLPWIAMATVALTALAVGTLGQDQPSNEQRAQNLAQGIRCPSCESQAVASSDTPSSQAVRALIAERIEAGDSDEEIRDFVDSRYPGQQLLLDPSGSGFGALVWALPVVLVVGAMAGLVVRFRGYRSNPRHATDADRDLVAAALGEQDEGS